MGAPEASASLASPYITGQDHALKKRFRSLSEPTLNSQAPFDLSDWDTDWKKRTW